MLPTVTESYEKECQTAEIVDSPVQQEPVVSVEKEQIVPLKEEQAVPVLKEFNQQEVTEIMHSDSFLSFFNEKSRIIERAINDSDIYDFMVLFHVISRSTILQIPENKLLWQRTKSIKFQHLLQKNAAIEQ